MPAHPCSLITALVFLSKIKIMINTSSFYISHVNMLALMVIADAFLRYSCGKTGTWVKSNVI